jgi:hypothetical protein
MGYITKCPYCHNYHDSNMDCSSRDRLKERADREGEDRQGDRQNERPGNSAASVNAKDLAYCPWHKRYYDRNLGCQLCYLDDSKSTVKEVFVASETIELRRCPKCKEKSLFWNSHSMLYECMNKRKCGRVFKQDDIDGKKGLFRRKVRTNSPTSKHRSK